MTGWRSPADTARSARTWALTYRTCSVVNPQLVPGDADAAGLEVSQRTAGAIDLR